MPRRAPADYAAVPFCIAPAPIAPPILMTRPTQNIAKFGVLSDQDRENLAGYYASLK